MMKQTEPYKPNRLDRIAVIINTLQVGGVEKFAVNFVNRLSETREMTLICLSAGGPLEKDLSSRVPLHVLNKKPGKNAGIMWRLAKLLKNEEIDLVYSNNWSTFFETVVAAKIAKIPNAVHIQHGLEYGDGTDRDLRKRWYRNKLRYIASLGTKKIVAVSQAGVRFITDEWGVERRKVACIYNGVEIGGIVDDATPVVQVPGYPVIGSVGRLTQVKNFKSMISAMNIVLDAFPSAVLLIIGEGPERPNLECLIRQNGLNDRVFLLGHRDDIWNVLGKMTLFINSSFSEGISLSLIEAMAKGLPIVATSVGGNPEVVLDGVTGRLIDVTDRESLARAIVDLLSHPDTLREMGKAALDRFNSYFTMDVMMGKYERLHEQILS